MVGVPGRSKGCSTCRKKRKGCDRNRPSCHQCIGSGLLCPGYERDLVWVNASPRLANVAGPGSNEPWHARYVRQKDSHNGVILLHDSLTRTAREERYLELFWSEYLPGGRSFSSQASELSTGGWTGELSPLYGSEMTLTYAAIALSASVVGAQRNDPELKIKGLHAYNRAVREMGIALLHPRRSHTDGLLAAARFLELHEVLFGREGDGCPEKDAGGGGWRQHNDGQLAMLQMRGPSGLKSQTAHQLFVDGRLNTIIVAIMRRKRCMLSHPDWKTKPWEGRRKSPKDRLLDIMADIPGLIEDYGKLYESRDHYFASETCKSALYQCEAIISALKNWRESDGSQIQVFDHGIARSQPPADQTAEDVGVLQMATLYWTSCLLVHLTKHRTVRLMAHTETNLEAPRESINGKDGRSQCQGVDLVTCQEARLQVDPKVFAYNIARSIHLLLEPPAGGYGGTVALFPLGVALQYLLAVEPVTQRSQELSALVGLFDRKFMGSSERSMIENDASDVGTAI